MTDKKVKRSKKQISGEIRQTVFGKRLKAVRNHLKLKQSEMADKLNISLTTMSDIETSKSFPCYEFFYRIAEYFNVNLYYLLFGTGEMIGKPEISNANGKKPEKNENEMILIVDNPDVREFLHNFTGSRVLQYRLMSEYVKLMNTDRDSILLDISRKDSPKPTAADKS